MPSPDRSKNLRLWSELLALYLVLPFAAWQLRAGGVRVPVIPLLLGVGPLAWWAIRQHWTPYGDLLVAGRTPRHEWRRIAWIFLAGALGITVYTHLYEPAHLFELPRQKPWVWLAILVGYPLLSVYPQEVIFRGCFFLRYGHLFPSTWSRVGASALGLRLRAPLVRQRRGRPAVDPRGPLVRLDLAAQPVAGRVGGRARPVRVLPVHRRPGALLLRGPALIRAPPHR